jgi:L-ornithine N5-oxygenase
MRNPRSRFSFVNYLHEVGRLDEFVNLGSFFPYRLEISAYLQWVATSLSQVRLEYGCRCTAIEPRRDPDGVLTGWLTTLGDGSTIGSAYLAIACGRDAHVPQVFADLPHDRVVHSTRYLTEVGRFAGDDPPRVAIVGGAQSAAEMFDAVQRDLPGCESTMIMRSIGLAGYENSKFTNELFYASFVDEFFGARPQAREQLLREMHRTNYGGLAPGLLDSLYRQVYVDRLTGAGRLRIRTLTDVTAAAARDGEIVLELSDRKTGAVDRLACDVVLLGTGFEREMPVLVRQLGQALDLDAIDVTRTYRLALPGPAVGACYLQGINEATHGIADSLLSVLSHRAAEIVDDVIRLRASRAPARSSLPIAA